MSLLARVKIITKILAVILLLAAVAVGTNWLGIHAMASMNDGAGNMGKAAKRALTGARASQNVLVLSRSEFRAALDPRPESRAEVRKIVAEQMKAFEERIEDIAKTRDEQAKAMMPAVTEAWAAYRHSMETTLRLADGVKDTQLSEVTAQRGYAWSGRRREIAGRDPGGLRQAERPRGSLCQVSGRSI